jgi:hypothetical protein
MKIETTDVVVAAVEGVKRATIRDRLAHPATVSHEIMAGDKRSFEVIMESVFQREEGWRDAVGCSAATGLGSDSIDCATADGMPTENAHHDGDASRDAYGAALLFGLH